MLDLENVKFDAGEPPAAKQGARGGDDRWTKVLHWCMEHPGLTVSFHSKSTYPMTSNVRTLARRRKLSTNGWHARSKPAEDNGHTIWVWYEESTPGA